jgi:MFS family permease
MSYNKISPLGLIVWFVCAIFFTYEFLLRTVLGTFQHPIMYDLSLTPFSFAILSTTAYMVIYGAMQVPVGLIADRFGLKKSLTLAVIICAISAFAFALTYQFKSAVFARMLMGLGSSFGFVCLLVAVYDWMPKKHYGLFIGLSQFIGTMGPMIAAGPFNDMALSGSVQWRAIFIGLGIFGFLLAIIVFCIVKNNPKDIGQFKIISKPSPIYLNISSIIRQKQTWFIAVYSALAYFSLEYFSENEGKVFIEMNGFSSSFSSYMITIGWLGYAIGCPLLGYISDLTKRRKILMVAAAIFCFISVLLIVFFPISKLILSISFFMLGVGAAGQSIGFAIMAEQCSKFYLAAGLGFNNAMIAIVCAVNAPIIGWLLDSHSQTESLSRQDYTFAFSFILILVSGALITSIFFIKETYCRPTKEYTVVKSEISQ